MGKGMELREGDTLRTFNIQDTGGTLYIGYITAGGDARLTFGTVADGFTERELPTPFAVQDVSVWVSGGYLMYAVVGVNDVAVGIARL